MTFQAHIDNIKAKTGKTPEQLKAAATKAGVYSPTMKATELVAWLKMACQPEQAGLDAGSSNMTTRHHLAQRNIATMLESLESPSMADFVASLGRICASTARRPKHSRSSLPSRPRERSR